MNLILHQIFQAQGESTLVLREILKVLHRERTCLVQLQINEISETTRLKENLNLQLILKSKRLKKLVEGSFSTLNDFEDKLNENERAQWNLLREEFWNLHAEIKTVCGVNQGFLKSSLRNLGTLSDHLRRLFGEQPLYSQKGTKVDRSSQGRVLEASY